MDDYTSKVNCTAPLEALSKSISDKLWRVNGLMLVNIVLMGVMVGIGAYAQRYRHYPLTRFLFHGATALFLPIISYVVAGTNNFSTIEFDFIGLHISSMLAASCHPLSYLWAVLVWMGLVQIVAVNTIAVVATDTKEGRSVPPSAMLIFEAIWSSYLVIYTMGSSSYHAFSIGNIIFSNKGWFGENRTFIASVITILPFSLIFAKMVFKCYAFYHARRSFSLGRNPQLVVGYMGQLPDTSQDAELNEYVPPPPLVVMGEDIVHVEKKANGCHIRSLSNQGDLARLISIDRVCQLDDMFMRSTAHLKDLHISFALFKLLRCRFARYTITKAKIVKVHNFFWKVLLRNSDDQRIFGLIADELSFIHDYYYSSLPISFSKSWLPILNIFLSLLSISYCIFTGISFTLLLVYDASELRWQRQFGVIGQLECDLWCNNRSEDSKRYGNEFFGIVPIFLLLALVILSEVRDIASLICSNWTKVTLICRYVANHNNWQQSPTAQKLLGHLLQCRCKMVKPWKDKMNQCSVLVIHQRKTRMSLLKCLSLLPGQKKNIKVPRAVKATIIDKLRSSNGILTNGVTSLRQSVPDGVSLLWACNGEGTTDILLVWHIATSILEVKHNAAAASTDSDNKVATIHLSRYCAYLVTYSPELLPDDDEWSKNLYKAVKEDAARALAGRAPVATPEEEYQQLVQLLSANSKHEVVKNGVKLAMELVELIHGEEAMWKVLAGFWSEMILYIAPSDNLEGHAVAIARGGELITLLWALLTHAGIVSRPSSDAAATASAVV